MEEKTYTIRPLQGKDIFPMASILSKIGIKEIKNCFQNGNITKVIEAYKSEKHEGESEDPTDNPEIAALGIDIAFDVASMLLENLPKCESDFYLLLSQLSGMTQKQVAELPMADFAQMVIDVITAKDFADFFRVVLKFVK